MATVGLPETRLAILPGAGGTHRLPALIGETRAMDLILTGRRIAGAEAYFLGIADRLVGPDQLHSTNMTKEEMEKEGKAERERVKQAAISMARDICEGGPLAIRMAMQAVEGWRDGGESEGRAYEKVVGTKDRDEALAAFREKRKPAFRGK